MVLSRVRASVALCIVHPIVCQTARALEPVIASGCVPPDGRAQPIAASASPDHKTGGGPLGIANFLYSDGVFVFGHGHRCTQADGIVAPPGLWVRHRRRSGAHAATIAPSAASGVTIHHEKHAASDVQEMTLLGSVPVSGGHWSPLAEGEVVVLSAGKVVERAGA
jgi:hypothetical protein